jgi:hypothetical protein
MVDRQWQKVLGSVQVKGVVDGICDAVRVVHGDFLSGWLTHLGTRKMKNAATERITMAALNRGNRYASAEMAHIATVLVVGNQSPKTPATIRAAVIPCAN